MDHIIQQHRLHILFKLTRNTDQDTTSWDIKKHLNKIKRIKIIQHLLSHHNGIKLAINKRSIAGKSQNT